jgi:phage/plasmid-like protein (TIGR03299 family)
MASGIVQEVDEIYSNEGTEWHGSAILTKVITKKEVQRILWSIAQSPALVEIDGSKIVLPNHKVLCADMRGVRTDLDESNGIIPLHIPKNGYQVITNEQVWDMMESALKDLDATITSVGTLEGGKKFFISVSIGESEMIVNKDKFKFFINFVTSHDGTIAMIVYDSSMRIVCMNTLRWSMQAAGDVNFRIMHTKNAELALKNLPELINAILTGRAEFKDVMEYLATCKVDNNDALAMAAGYFCLNTGDEELSSRSMNAATEIATLFSRGIACYGETLYDLANGATEYWTSGLGTGRNGVDEGTRLYRSSMGSAAEHKQMFVAMLANEDRRKEALKLGRTAVKLANA